MAVSCVSAAGSSACLAAAASLVAWLIMPWLIRAASRMYVDAPSAPRMLVIMSEPYRENSSAGIRATTSSSCAVLLLVTGAFFPSGRVTITLKEPSAFSLKLSICVSITRPLSSVALLKRGSRFSIFFARSGRSFAMRAKSYLNNCPSVLVGSIL